MSRSWNFTQSAPAATDRSTSSLASATEPWWLMPISLITKAGLSAADDVPADPELVARG